MVKKRFRKLESRSKSLTEACKTHFIANTKEGAVNHTLITHSHQRLNFYSITKEKITFQKSLKLNFPVDVDWVPECTFVGKNRIIFRVYINHYPSGRTKKFMKKKTSKRGRKI